MSEVMNYCAFRLKLGKKFVDNDDFYNYIRGYIGDADDINYRDGKVKSFYYNEIKDRIVPKYENNDWYLDYMLEDITENNQDLQIAFDYRNLSSIYNFMMKKFGNDLTGDSKLVVCEWYNGADMPWVW